MIFKLFRPKGNWMNFVTKNDVIKAHCPSFVLIHTFVIRELPKYPEGISSALYRFEKLTQKAAKVCFIKSKKTNKKNEIKSNQNSLYAFTCSSRHGSRFVTDGRSRTGPCLAAVGTLRTWGTRCARLFRRLPGNNDRWFWIRIRRTELSETASVRCRRCRRWCHRVRRRKRLLRPPRNSIATDAC